MRPVVNRVRDELREHHLVRGTLGILVGHYAIGARIGQRLDERAAIGVGLLVGLVPGTPDRVVAPGWRLAFPTGQPDPRRPEQVMQVASDGAEIRVDRSGELLRRHPVDCGQNLVVRPLVVRDELTQLVAVRHRHRYLTISPLRSTGCGRAGCARATPRKIRRSRQCTATWRKLEYQQLLVTPGPAT